MFKVGIITVSDRSFRKEREDLSGKAIKDIISAKNYNIACYEIVPDQEDKILDKIIKMVDEAGVDLVLTTGGTGFSSKDVTPEATIKAIEKNVPGISEAIRNYSLQITPKAMLSRAVSGIRKQTLIINLPGSPKAVQECLTYIIDILQHGLEVLQGKVTDCGR